MKVCNSTQGISMKTGTKGEYEKCTMYTVHCTGQEDTYKKFDHALYQQQRCSRLTSGSGCCNMLHGPNFSQVIKSRYIQFKIHFIYIFIKFFFFWFSCTESAAAAYFPLMPTALAHLTTSSYGAAQRSCTLAQTTTCRLICTRITPAVTYNFHCA